MTTTTYNQSGLVYDQANLTFDGNAPGLANLPVVGVFLAFDDGPYVADPDWVEVTDYVRDITVRRGRSDDLQQFPAGQASVTFDNRDRLFDPFNTSGTYYGKLKPRRQIKIVAQWAGVNYPVFRGFVAGWPVEWSEGGKDSTVTVDCFDALGLMANETVPSDWVGEYTRSISPAHYWRCNEAQPITNIIDEIGGWTTNAVIGSSPIGASEDQPLSVGLRNNSVYSPNWRYLKDNSTFYGGNIALAAWVKITDYNSGGVISGIGYNNGGQEVYLLRSATAGQLLVRISSITGTTAYLRDYEFVAPTGTRTNPLHIAINMTYAAGTYATAQIYVNGTLLSVAVFTQFTFTTSNYRDAFNLFYTSAQEVSAYNRLLTADEIKQLYDFGSSRVYESSSARINRLLGTTEFPTALTSIDASPSAFVSDIGLGEGVIPEMNRVTDSEDGELFVDASGVLTFRDRYGWSGETHSNTSQVTFTDTGTGVYYDAESLLMNVDADQVRNDVTVTFSSNGQVTGFDQDSIDENGAASETVSTLLANGVDSQTLADYRVSIYKNPKLRVEPFLVKGQRNPSYDWPRILALDLLDRFTFVRTPSVGSAIQRDMLLQSIEHRITPGTWETIINGSARYTGWFILGVSKLGSTEDVLL